MRWAVALAALLVGAGALFWVVASGPEEAPPEVVGVPRRVVHELSVPSTPSPAPSPSPSPAPPSVAPSEAPPGPEPTGPSPAGRVPVTAAAGDPDLLTSADAHLLALESALRRRGAADAEVVGALDAVAQDYLAMAEDPRPEAARFRRDAEKAFVRALGAPGPGPRTVREAVALRAAVIVGEAENASLSAEIVQLVERVLRKAEPPPSAALWEAVFAALGDLNQESSLEWMLEEYVHTKSSPASEVDQLVAAHKAMTRFTGVKGRLRYEIAKTMIVTYAALESAAQKTTDDPKVQAAKAFWDRIRPDTVHAIQHFARERFETVREFQAWLREHDNPKRAPWAD